MNNNDELLTNAMPADMIFPLRSCIFVWRLPPEVTEHMHSRLVELGKKAALDTPWHEGFDRYV